MFDTLHCDCLAIGATSYLPSGIAICIGVYMPDMARTPARWTIICDFDGTIAPTDVTDQLLERYASPEWLQFERAWQANAISSRECLIKQTELVEMTRKDLQDFLAPFHIDPAFGDFVKYAQDTQCNVQVASEGYTQVISILLNHAGTPPLPIAATYMIPDGSNRWMLGCPFSAPGCDSDAATCKCAVASEGRAGDSPTLLIGDGRSDFCLASRADFIFARGALLEHCRQHSLPHVEVQNFTEAKHHLAALLAADFYGRHRLPSLALVPSYG